MKKWTLYILLSFASLIPWSCSSILDKEEIPGQDRLGITFTLSMSSAGPATRSISPDQATRYENTIDPDQFRVLAYTPDGSTHEVTIFSMEELSRGTYKISGELKGIYSINKVVILANCDQNFNPSTPLNTLTYTYSKSDFNPESPKCHIPMWGVKQITTPLKPGVSTNIGTINLLRAVAKIQVSLSQASVGCNLTQVAITQYHHQGACVPGMFETLTETEDVTEATIPNGATRGTNLPFYQTNDNTYILYLPEYKNKNSQNPAGIAVSITDINGAVHQKTVSFGKYAAGAFTNEPWDILRNHSYHFSLRMEVAIDASLNLQVETEKYAEFLLEPVYGD